VINTVLAAMLHEAGYPVRMAVGWTASNGAANPGLHAWVEVDRGGGRWLVADATRGRIPVDAESAPSGNPKGGMGQPGSAVRRSAPPGRWRRVGRRPS
jgi:arylamine N-acetyltransferase